MTAANEAVPEPMGTAASTTPSENEKGKVAQPVLLRLRRHWKIVMVVSSLVTLAVIIIALLVTFVGVRRAAPNITVDLGYAKYRGVKQRDADVKAWLGMRYAAAPVGELRFAAPQDPPRVDQMQDAARHGKFCLAVGDKPPVNPRTSEDCLFIDVFAPSSATPQSRLPVFFFIQGGGFAGNANANYNGAGLIDAGNRELIVVTFNYRVGPYGFLSGKDISSPNNGLKDQRKALNWVQQHISKFGGNPGHVVLGGDSAGGASIAIHLTAYGGKDEKLFHAAAMESPSFATVLDNAESQFQYEAFVNETACAGVDDTFTCLRNLPLDQLQQANRPYPYPGAAGRPVYSWNPVVDGDLIQNLTYTPFYNGKFVNVPTIVGDDTNGGTIFVPRGTDSLQASNQFLINTFPYLNQSHIDRLNQLYPNNPNDTFPNSGSYWRRTANLYGDIRYMCPNLFLAAALTTYGKTKSVPVWNYRFNVQDPSQISRGLGVPHVSELSAIWGPSNVDDDPVPNSFRKGGQNAAIVPVMQAYWTSFIRTLNPNTHREPGMPEWEKWSTEIATGTETDGIQLKENDHERLLFDSPVKNTRMEVINSDLWASCEYIWSIALDIQQ